MEIKDIRLQNVLELAKGYDRIAKFCEAIEMAPSYFSQLKNQTKTIGTDRARQIENALNLPTGWMDTLHEEKQQGQMQLPSEDLGVAYALSSLPESIRTRIKSLVYELAAIHAEKDEAESKTKRNRGA